MVDRLSDPASSDEDTASTTSSGLPLPSPLVYDISAREPEDAGCSSPPRRPKVTLPAATSPAPVKARIIPFIWELLPLPEGWVECRDEVGRAYYKHNNTNTATNLDPRYPYFELQTTPFPPGWEVRYTTTNIPYFVNHNKQTTSWTDPRAFSAETMENVTARLDYLRTFQTALVEMEEDYKVQHAKGKGKAPMKDVPRSPEEEYARLVELVGRFRLQDREQTDGRDERKRTKSESIPLLEKDDDSATTDEQEDSEHESDEITSSEEKSLDEESEKNGGCKGPLSGEKP